MTTTKHQTTIEASKETPTITITRESLPPFVALPPCGISGVSMSCLENEAGREISVSEAAGVIGDELREVFTRA